MDFFDVHDFNNFGIDFYDFHDFLYSHIDFLDFHDLHDSHMVVRTEKGIGVRVPQPPSVEPVMSCVKQNTNGWEWGFPRPLSCGACGVWWC